MPKLGHISSNLRLKVKILTFSLKFELIWPNLGTFSGLLKSQKQQFFALKIGTVRVFYGLTVNSLGDF